jgi:hypothetical protein
VEQKRLRLLLRGRTWRMKKLPVDIDPTTALVRNNNSFSGG